MARFKLIAYLKYIEVSYKVKNTNMNEKHIYQSLAKEVSNKFIIIGYRL